MGPWSRQAEFESGLARLRNATPSRIEELTALALAEPRASYKGVIGALTHGIKKAKPRHRLPLLRLLSAVVVEAHQKFGAQNLYAERARPDIVRCIAAACRCPPEQLDDVGSLLSTWAAQHVFPAETLRCCEAEVEEAVATRLAVSGGGDGSSSDSDYEVDPAAQPDAAREPSPPPPPLRKKAWPALAPAAPLQQPQSGENQGQQTVQPAPPQQQPWRDRSPVRRSPPRRRSRSPPRRRSRTPPRRRSRTPPRRRSRSPPRHGHERRWSPPSRHAPPPPPPPRAAEQPRPPPGPPPRRAGSEDYDPFAPR